jgi:hypothetical protein
MAARPRCVNYRDRSGRTVKNDNGGSAGVLAAFSDAYRVLKPDSFCVCFYGWNRVDEFFGAWRQAGFRPVGHVVWQKDYASSSGFLQSRHEQAYLLIKGNPDRPGYGGSVTTRSTDALGKVFKTCTQSPCTIWFTGNVMTHRPRPAWLFPLCSSLR